MLAYFLFKEIGNLKATKTKRDVIVIRAKLSENVAQKKEIKTHSKRESIALNLHITSITFANFNIIPFLSHLSD